MRVVGFLATVGLIVAPIVPGAAAGADDPAPGSDEHVLVDAALERVLDATDSSGRVRVELLTEATAHAARQVRAVGGTVTGAVPGELVQATLPAGRVQDLALADPALARLPQRVNRPPSGGPRDELGSVTGQGVAVTGAAAWHAAGLRGGVKVGIIDFFDLGLWDETEHGTAPDAAHLFCLDTSGQVPNFCPMAIDGFNSGDGDEHGIAVVEVLKDMAPDAELFLATVATTSDMYAAIDWFAANGVVILSRSLGAPYDGPGDGTGPLAALVDHAADVGITWFNSAGNDGDGGYGRFTSGVAADGYVDFDDGPGVDTRLTLTGMCFGFDGVRWSDWGKSAASTTDYRVEISIPGVGTVHPPDNSQVTGAPPLEMADAYFCTLAGSIELRLRRIAKGTDPTPDVVELGLFSGRIEAGRSDSFGSASKGVVDSRNPAMLAVGAVDPPTSGNVASYSAKGPTNDGRVKPDVVAPSCVASTIYSAPTYGPAACFNGTSAAAPAAAGLAAVLASRGLARAGAPLAMLVRHLALDVGPPGPDNVAGTGLVRLPPPPPDRLDTRPAQFRPLGVATRILDTRASSLTGTGAVGPFAPSTVLDLPIPAVDAAGGQPITAVAVSVVSVDSPIASYVQALPTLMGQLGGFANLNVARPGQIKPNFAIVPVGVGGSISLFLAAGGNVVVDLMGVFTVAPPEGATAGRFVATDAVRVLDTRTGVAGGKLGSLTTVPVTGAPLGASAVVVNITATEAERPGFLRAQQRGSGLGGLSGVTTANGNFEPGASSGMLSVVPVGADGSFEIFTSAPTHVVVDLVGWFTSGADPISTSGLYVAVTPSRAYDSRFGPGAHIAETARPVSIAGPGTPVPSGAAAVSANVAADAAGAEGFLTLFPTGGGKPFVSNLNYPAGAAISNAAIARTGASGTVEVHVNRTTHVIIDVNGYFTGSG